MAPPREGPGVVKTTWPSIDARSGSGVGDLVAREVSGELGHQLGHGRRTDVADALERGDELVRLDPARGAVDPPAPLVALEDPRQDRVQESLLVGGVESRSGELDRGLDELAATGCSRTGGAPPRARRRVRAPPRSPSPTW